MLKLKSFTALWVVANVALSVAVAAADGDVPTLSGAPTDSVREAPRILNPHEAGAGRLAPEIEVTSIAGNSFRLGGSKSARATVVAFFSASCPVSKRFAPTLVGLEREYAPRGVEFVFVDPLKSNTPDDLRTAISEHQFKGPFIHDTENRVREALGARSTTEVFVLDAARTVVYRGAVDDQYGLGYSLDAPKRRYLAGALDAVLDGRRPEISATTAPGCALEGTASLTQSRPVEFHDRVSRIMQQHCQECHHKGGVAPFALVSYDDVASHAGMIRKMVGSDRMPPWFAAPPPIGEHSPWANDRSLPADDKRDLIAWIDDGKKEGSPSDAPLPLTFPSDWQIGTPDAFVQIPTPIDVKATGKMPYKDVFVETDFKEDRWVRALEVRPTAREVVHHVLVFVVPERKNAGGSTDRPGRRRRGGDDEGGNFFAAYVPGNNRLEYPDGFAKLLPAGATLHFQIHYTPNGTATQDQTRLGMIFSKEPPQHEVHVVGIANLGLRIPPGAANHEVRANTPVLFNAKLMAFMPHMHLRGKAFRFELGIPAGSRRMLLDVPRYDFNWQLQYKLAEPLDAPIGSRLLATGWFDNSTDNPANPDPAREVRWGPQTDDEMMLGYVEYYVPGLKPGEKLPLAEAILRDGALLFNFLDRNQDGKITRDESPSPESFRQADADNDESVTREELKAFLDRSRR